MSRRPRTRRIVEPPEGLEQTRCPECPSETPVAHPGYVDWASRWLAKTGELPPPAPRDVPSWAWWWCSSCDNGGVHLPEPPPVVILGPGQCCPLC